jgi:putative endonuclease
MAYTYTYIVECRSKAGGISYYVGGTNNPRQRISDHLAGKGAKYLRGREILRVIYTDKCTGYGEISNEHVIKHGKWEWLVSPQYVRDDGTMVPRDAESCWIHIHAWTHEQKRRNVEDTFTPATINRPMLMVHHQFWRPFWHRTPEGGVFD